jgi:hypothetical protein
MTTPAAGPPDPRKSLYIFCSGKKNCGKSHVCRAWWDSYPFDKLVIDVTHDIRDDLRADGAQFTDLDPQVLPARLPDPVDDDAAPRAWTVCPDMGSPSWEDDVDRAVGLCMRGKDNPTLLWVDEFGAVTSGNKTGPNMRRVLHHGRHHNLSLLLACPRPMDVDTLGISQADLVYTFRTPVVQDREKIAKNIGFEPREFDQVNAELPAIGEHAYTLYDARTDQLDIMPPLPPRRRGRNAYPPLPV